MAVGVIVPYLKFQENRRQEQENQGLNEPHKQFNRQKRHTGKSVQSISYQ